MNIVVLNVNEKLPEVISRCYFEIFLVDLSWNAPGGVADRTDVAAVLNESFAYVSIEKNQFSATLRSCKGVRLSNFCACLLSEFFRL